MTLLPCPQCDSVTMTLTCDRGQWSVLCVECMREVGPCCNSQEAEEEWNQAEVIGS